MQNIIGELRNDLIKMTAEAENGNKRHNGKDEMRNKRMKWPELMQKKGNMMQN